jgi:lysozyme
MRNTALAALLVSVVGGFEGLRQKAYLDPVGIPTICFGETRGVQLGQTKTRDECDAMLVESLLRHERGMVACIDNPQALPDKTYGAFLSFTYNVGVGAFCKSTLLRLVNRGKLFHACDQLPRWTRVTIGSRKVVLRGLVKRRAQEREMCLEGLLEVMAS